MLEDIGWNNGGARNLGAQMARDQWLFLCDMDYFLPEETVESMLSFIDEADPQSYFTFEALMGNRLQIPPPNILLIRRSDFWQVGGYDEDLAGHYGGEDILFRQVMDRQLNWVHTRMLLLADKETMYDPPASRGDRTALEINDSQLRAKLADRNYRAKRPIRFRWSKVGETPWQSAQSESPVTAMRASSDERSRQAWEVRWEEASRCAASGQYEAARIHYEGLLATAPTDRKVIVANNLAVLAACLGEADRGLTILNKLAELKTVEAVVQHNQAVLAQLQTG